MDPTSDQCQRSVTFRDSKGCAIVVYGVVLRSLTSKFDHFLYSTFDIAILTHNEKFEPVNAMVSYRNMAIFHFYQDGYRNTEWHMDPCIHAEFCLKVGTAKPFE